MFDLLTNLGLSHWHQPGEQIDPHPARSLSVGKSMNPEKKLKGFDPNLTA
jgi:hypothetical protein